MRGHAESVLKRLDMGLTKSSGMAWIYPFKKKEVGDMLLRVERRKTSLLLANQLFESYVSALFEWLMPYTMATDTI